MQMAAFSSCEFTSCRALRIATETAKFQIIIYPTDITKQSIRTNTRRAVRQTTIAAHNYRCNSSSIVNGLGYKQRRKKVT